MKTTPGMNSTGPETWKIDGQDWTVDKTYTLAFDTKTLQYTMEHECGDCDFTTAFDDTKAFVHAFPLMRYAYEHRYYERTKRIGGQASYLIGVELYRIENGRRHGYRVSRTPAEIQAEIDARDLAKDEDSR